MHGPHPHPYGPHPYGPHPYGPHPYQNQPSPQMGQHPSMAQAMGYGAAGGALGRSFLDRVTTGQIVEMVAELFAALQSLPAAPVATNTAETDIANSVLYQTALAQHAKRDEQVRTLGHLVARLIG
jgi:hypothetical protein